MAWLSEDQLHELEQLEASGSSGGRDSRAEKPPRSDKRSGRSVAADATTPTEAREEDSRAGEATEWMDQAERAMEVWADVFGAVMDHSNAVSQEELEARSRPFAEWVGHPPQVTEAIFS
ncbi:hypothetical protein BD414DRAFT_491403 [Trametes punicea]|nr:hypothetical protein BD414DRAFT_491403 [Trametes punicea]